RRGVAEHRDFVGGAIGGGKRSTDQQDGAERVEDAGIHWARTSRLSKWMGVSELPKRAGAPNGIGRGTTTSIDQVSGSRVPRGHTLPRINAWLSRCSTASFMVYQVIGSQAIGTCFSMRKAECQSLIWSC